MRKTAIVFFGTGICLLVVEGFCFLGSIFIDRHISQSEHNPYKWSFENSKNRVGFLYQDQQKKLTTIRDGLFGTLNRPWGVLFTQDNIEGKPYGHLYVDADGWVRNETGFVKRPIVPGEEYLIIITGGSTTAGLGVEKNEDTIAAQLEVWLNEHAYNLQGRKFRVLNAGVPGNNLSQELNLFQFDLQYLKPEVWIAFSGINEAWKFGKMIGSTELHYHRSFLGFRGRDVLVAFSVLPAIQKFFLYFCPLLINPWRPDLRQKKTYGVTSVAERFHNLRLLSMYAAKSAGTKFISYLQPTLAVSKKKVSVREQVFIDETLQSDFWQKYKVWGATFYREVLLLQQSSGFSELKDLADIFDAIETDIYYDPRHYNRLGNFLIAERIGNDLMKKNFVLSKRRSQATFQRHDKNL